MFGMNGEYNLDNIRSFSEDLGIGQNTRMNSKQIKQLFFLKYPPELNRRSVISLDGDI